MTQPCIVRDCNAKAKHGRPSPVKPFNFCHAHWWQMPMGIRSGVVHPEKFEEAMRWAWEFHTSEDGEGPGGPFPAG